MVVPIKSGQTAGVYVTHDYRVLQVYNEAGQATATMYSSRTDWDFFQIQEFDKLNIGYKNLVELRSTVPNFQLWATTDRNVYIEAGVTTDGWIYRAYVTDEGYRAMKTLGIL